MSLSVCIHPGFASADRRAFTQTLSLLNRAWKSGFDVVMLTTDTWQLGWRPTDINIANYV